MVGNGHSSILPLEFSNRIHPNLPVEVTDRSDVIRRLGRPHFTVPSRPTFHSLHLVHSGHGFHTVDFEQAPLRPGVLLQIRPGQVQMWNVERECEATLVLSRLPRSRMIGEFSTRAAYRDLDRDSLATANAIIDALRREQARFEGHEASARLMNALFDALCALFDHGTAERAQPLPAAYVAFRQAIEGNLSVNRTVRELVSGLGYSERTVSRACHTVTGRSAREVVSARLVLEAKRLLAHTDEPAAAISTQLGFSEPTNFQKFFTRHVGQRPIQFRDIHRR
jgi:AraC-like DNA-binding protein